jgi:hypothetical protein
MGMIPKKTKSETKVFKGLTAQRFLGLFMVIMLSAMIGQLIGGVLQWLFIAFSLIVYFVLSGKSPSNPTQSFAKGLIEFIRFKIDNQTFLGTTNADYIAANSKKEKENDKKIAEKSQGEEDNTENVSE